MRRAVMVIALIVVAVGCAGRDFVRPSTDSLLLSKTTETEIRQRFGKPYREGTMVKNGETLRTLSYAYAEGAASLAGGVVPARGQGFYFRQATEASVIALLGTPQGVYLYPLIKDKASRAMVYLYQQTRGSALNLKFFNQLLVVTLDDRGVVKDVELTSSGQR
jgi:hypothetical protein